MKVRGGSAGELAAVHLVQLRENCDNPSDMSRFVPRPTMRNGRKKGAVGFRQQPVEWHRSCRLTQVVGFRKRHDAGQRDEKPQVESALRKRGSPGEAMQDADHLAAPFFSQSGDRLLIGFPGVHDHRKLQFPRQSNLRPKQLALHVPWGEVVVVIEANLPHGADQRRRSDPGTYQVDRQIWAIRVTMRPVWMDADSDPYLGPDRLETYGLCRLLRMTRFQHYQRPLQSGLLRTRYDRLQVGAEGLVRKMTMGINH